MSKPAKTKRYYPKDFMKYRNPDQRCRYPFTPDPVGYCWGYALHIDGTPGYEDMGSHCPQCEFWKERQGCQASE